VSGAAVVSSKLVPAVLPCNVVNGPAAVAARYTLYELAAATAPHETVIFAALPVVITLVGGRFDGVVETSFDAAPSPVPKLLAPLTV